MAGQGGHGTSRAGRARPPVSAGPPDARPRPRRRGRGQEAIRIRPRLEDRLPQRPVRSGPGPGAGGTFGREPGGPAPEGESPAPAETPTPESKTPPGPDPGSGAVANGGADQNIGAIPASEPPRPRRLPKPSPADADRDKAIEEELERTVSLTFPVGTPLNEILRSIRDTTKNEKSGLKKGIPIYVDPIVLIEDNPGQERRAKSLVTIVPVEIEDLPLRVALRLILDQFSLAYQVRDRMVYVIDEEFLDFRTEGALEFMKANGLRSGQDMGGMGGIGGMGGMGGGMR